MGALPSSTGPGRRETAGDVLARRGRQGEDDAKRFFDVRGLGLVETVGAGGEVLDHVVEVDARLVGQEVHAHGAGASRGSRELTRGCTCRSQSQPGIGLRWRFSCEVG